MTSPARSNKGSRGRAAIAPVQPAERPGKSARKPSLGVILCPTDFSRESWRALEYASLLLKVFQGKLHLLHVHEVEYAYGGVSAPTQPPVVPADEIRLFHETRLKEMAARFFPEGTPAETHVKIGRAFDQVCELADEIDARLIVISTHGRTGLKRVLVGSTTERVVQHARCPVLVVREHEREMAGLHSASDSTARKLKILVPIDFSECSRHGLNYALSFARPWDAEIVLLHTVKVLPPISPDHYSAYDHAPSLGVIERAAKGQMRKMVNQTDFAGVPYQTEIQIGNPAQQICQYAEDHAIDLIVTSTHGLTGFAHVLTGSVAEHVVRYAHCPVLVVPRDKGPQR